MEPIVMGVLNVTPDSFSDGGRFLAVGDAVAQAEAMIDAGARIIDIGGESTRPGALAVPPATQIERIAPVIERLADHDAVRQGDVELSVDARHPEVARAAVAGGATIINDVGAGLGWLAAELGVGWIAMHLAGQPESMQQDPWFDDVVGDVLADLVDRATLARAAGAPRIWIDPGIGFGKTLEHNLALIGALDRLVASGWPVALGVSRKASLGILTARADGAADPASAEDRLEAALAVATWAMHCGVAVIRAHDVLPHVRAARVIAGEIESAA